ncbi:hypothetical protein L0222_16250 [bacterium]|nr:hypothetical protein [bacterium]MCI0603901.1 hypothetical protein [bacterium]
MFRPSGHTDSVTEAIQVPVSGSTLHFSVPRGALEKSPERYDVSLNPPDAVVGVRNPLDGVFGFILKASDGQPSIANQPCLPKIQVNSVRAIGQSAGKDLIEVLSQIIPGSPPQNPEIFDRFQLSPLYCRQQYDFLDLAVS